MPLTQAHKPPGRIPHPSSDNKATVRMNCLKVGLFFSPLHQQHLQTSNVEISTDRLDLIRLHQQDSHNKDPRPLGERWAGLSITSRRGSVCKRNSASSIKSRIDPSATRSKQPKSNAKTSICWHDDTQVKTE